MEESRFVGEWMSTYSYHNGIDMSQHVMHFAVYEDTFVGTSKPQDDGSELQLMLRYDSERSTLTGTWREKTSAQGRFKGAVFHGAVQFILTAKGTKAVGKWVGHNSDFTHVNSGGWRLQKQTNT